MAKTLESSSQEEKTDSRFWHNGGIRNENQEKSKGGDLQTLDLGRQTSAINGLKAEVKIDG